MGKPERFIFHIIFGEARVSNSSGFHRVSIFSTVFSLTNAAVLFVKCRNNLKKKHLSETLHVTKTSAPVGHNNPITNHIDVATIRYPIRKDQMTHQFALKITHYADTRTQFPPLPPTAL